jgi:hypothetical protein
MTDKMNPDEYSQISISKFDPNSALFYMTSLKV